AESAELAPLPIHPDERSVHGPRQVSHAVSDRRDRQSVVLGPVADLLEHGSGLPDNLQASGIETPREEGVVTREQKVAGIGEDGGGVRMEESADVFRIERGEHDGGLLRIEVARHEHEMPPVRKESRMEVGDVPLPRVERRDRLRRASRRGNGDDGSAELLREENRALTTPRAGERRPALADRLGGAALRADALESPFREERNLTAVGRPEHAARVLGAGQPPHPEAVERPDRDRGSSSLVLDQKQNAPCIWRESDLYEEALAGRSHDREARQILGRR